MHRLKGRLRRLEARIEPAAPSWNDYYARAEERALRMLSPADRALAAEGIQLTKTRGYNAWTETQRSVWDRWSLAFDKAVVELGIPWSITAADAAL